MLDLALEIKQEEESINNGMNIEIKSDVDNLVLFSDLFPTSLSLRIDGFDTEKEQHSFIKSCVKLIRTSVEYKLWKKYLIDVLGVTTCSITNEDMSECSIEIHHHVPSIYAVTKAVVNKRIEDDKPFSSFDIALDVIELHFKNKIGYVPLLNSMHEKFHNGFLNIPIEYVRGDYKSFLNEYLKYLDEEDVKTIDERLIVKLNKDEPPLWTKDNYPGFK